MYKVENPTATLNYCDYIHNVTTLNGTESHIKFFNSATEKTYNLKVSTKNMTLNGDFLYLSFELKGKPVEVFATQLKSSYNCPHKFKDVWESLFTKDHNYPKGSVYYGE